MSFTRTSGPTGGRTLGDAPSELTTVPGFVTAGAALAPIMDRLLAFAPAIEAQHAALLARVEARVERDPNSGCWLWSGTVRPSGYGTLALRKAELPLPPSRRVVTAHRLTYTLWRGSIPDGLVLDHKCRTRSCVNPDHLRAVTNRTNLLENSESPCARWAARTHCDEGHLLTPDNQYVELADHFQRGAFP